MSFSSGEGGGQHHSRAHPAPAFGLADQPPAKRMRRTDNNAFQNDAAAQTRAGSASSTTSPFPFSSPPFQRSGTQTANDGHAHPSFIISPDRDWKFGAFGGAGHHAPIACAQHSASSWNSPAPAAAALWFDATPAPTAESGAVMQITQDSISDIDEPPPPMQSKEQKPREWWKQRPATIDGAGTTRSSTTSAAAAAAAASSSLSASSSFSSLALHGAAVPLSSATTRCHVCNVNEAPPLQSLDQAESYASAGAHCDRAHQPSHWHGSPYVANGLSHHSPAFHAAGHRQHANHYSQHLPQTLATTEGAGAPAPARQKNSLLSYFQVRKPPAVCSTPSRPTSSCSSSGAANSSTPHPHTHSIHPTSASVGPSSAAAPPSVLTCSYCERPSCPSCTRHCQSCSKRYCTFCSTVNYDESREERVFCLDCHHDAHSVAIGTVAETSHGGGCMDMEE